MIPWGRRIWKLASATRQPSSTRDLCFPRTQVPDQRRLVQISVIQRRSGRRQQPEVGTSNHDNPGWTFQTFRNASMRQKSPPHSCCSNATNRRFDLVRILLLTQTAIMIASLSYMTVPWIRDAITPTETDVHTYWFLGISGFMFCAIAIACFFSSYPHKYLDACLSFVELIFVMIPGVL
jgi:hypothetical protein